MAFSRSNGLGHLASVDSNPAQEPAVGVIGRQSRDSPASPDAGEPLLEVGSQRLSHQGERLLEDLVTVLEERGESAVQRFVGPLFPNRTKGPHAGPGTAHVGLGEEAHEGPQEKQEDRRNVETADRRPAQGPDKHNERRRQEQPWIEPASPGRQRHDTDPEDVPCRTKRSQTAGRRQGRFGTTHGISRIFPGPQPAGFSPGIRG